MEASDLERSAAHYRTLAARYDHFTRRIDRIRIRAIDALQLQAGDAVLDAGCGTGWCIPPLARRVGATGRVVAFDPSPDMLAFAKMRAQESPGDVLVLRGSGEELTLTRPVDAILFSYTHDLLRSQAAVDNILLQARAGARVAATGSKLFSRWLGFANGYLRYSHRKYITNFEGFESPWSLLEPHLDDFRVVAVPWRQHYLATGTVRKRD
jgi:arsenite methyltransferase